MDLNFHKIYYWLIDEAFANNSLVNIKLSNTQMSKIIQLGGFLGRLLGKLMRFGLSLMKIVLMLFTKSVLIPLGLTSESAADAKIPK